MSKLIVLLFISMLLMLFGACSQGSSAPNPLPGTAPPERLVKPSVDFPDPSAWSKVGQFSKALLDKRLQRFPDGGGATYGVIIAKQAFPRAQGQGAGYSVGLSVYSRIGYRGLTNDHMWQTVGAWGLYDVGDVVRIANHVENTFFVEEVLVVAKFFEFLKPMEGGEVGE